MAQKASSGFRRTREGGRATAGGPFTKRSGFEGARSIQSLLPAGGDTLDVTMEDLRWREQRKTIVVMSIVIPSEKARAARRRGPSLLRLATTLRELRPRLLLLDPLVRTHRIDENSSADISRLLGLLRELQREHALAIAVVHHMSKRLRSYSRRSVRRLKHAV